MKLLLLLPFLVSCTSMAWQVDDTTTVDSLNQRYHSEVADLTTCDEYDWVFECPEYHRIWRRYWSARRELAARSR